MGTDQARRLLEAGDLAVDECTEACAPWSWAARWGTQPGTGYAL
ncbi:MAG TPA: hypothetical protein VGJ45_09720 [Pseudonocardiaceae bacterium]